MYRNPAGTDASGVHGTPGQVREKLEELVSLGATHLLLNPVGRYAEQVEMLAGLVTHFRLDASEIFDIDCHLIPARKADPEHFHYDVRYVVRAGEDESFVVSEESHDLAWRESGGLVGDPSLDLSVRRMAEKWLARR